MSWSSIDRYTRHFNFRLTLSVVLIAISQFNYGFDNQAFATTQAMDAFNRQFGNCDAQGKCDMTSLQLALLNGLPYFGFAIGLLLGSLTSEKWGRRNAMFFMSIYALAVPAMVVITARTYIQILMGRVLNYIYVGMELATVPVFQSEIVPGEVRGFIVSTYQLSINSGALVMNLVARVTGNLPDNRAYRIPFGLFYVIPTIIMLAMSTRHLVPESPRWLLTRDRVDEARITHRQYRRGTMPDDAIDEEFQALRQGLLDEPQQATPTLPKSLQRVCDGRPLVRKCVLLIFGFNPLFEGTNKKRTWIVMGVNFFQQATGQAFVSQYGARFIKSLDTVDPFTITASKIGISIVVVICALMLADRLGRRKMLQIGAAVQTISMVTMGALGTRDPLRSGDKTGIIVSFIFFAVGFAFGWAPLTYVVTTELPSLRLRDLSQRLASLVNILMNFAVNFTVPYMINEAGLQSRVGFIFGGITVLSFLFVYLCVPECKGRSLEEVDRLFNDGVRIRDFAGHSFGDHRPAAAAASSGGQGGPETDGFRQRRQPADKVATASSDADAGELPSQSPPSNQVVLRC